MEDKEVKLETGTAIIDVLDSMKLTVRQMLCEFIDNSFGAGAVRVSIRKKTHTLTIEDDGRGCINPEVMFSPAKSHRHQADKAGRFGIGCPFAMIKGSRKGLATVVSVCGGVMARMVVDWGECASTGIFEPKISRFGVAGEGQGSGTTIILQPSMQFQDSEGLAKDLGYYYAKELRSGREIVLEIGGKEIPVRAYEPPPSVRGTRLKFDVEVCGHRVAGRGWLVPASHQNEYPGWSIHYGYRFFEQATQPADGRSCKRIYAEVYLPSKWENIGISKDYFKTNPDDLYMALADQFSDLIERANDGQEDEELKASSKAVEDILSAIIPGKGRVKGSRPGTAGKVGTVNPSGRGSSHKDFTTTQPGDKAESDDSPQPIRFDGVRVLFDEISRPLDIKVDGLRSRTLVITFSTLHSQFAIFKDTPRQAASACLLMIASWITRGSDGSQKLFPELAEMEFQDVLQDLIKRVHPNESEKAA